MIENMYEFSRKCGIESPCVASKEISLLSINRDFYIRDVVYCSLVQGGVPKNEKKSLEIILPVPA
ncbi:hypothetical protein ACS0TY_008176 [Phlomoides rotata]